MGILGLAALLGRRGRQLDLLPALDAVGLLEVVELGQGLDRDAVLLGDALERVLLAGGHHRRADRALVLGGDAAAARLRAAGDARLVRQLDRLAGLQPIGLLQVVQARQVGHRHMRLLGQALDGVVAAHGDGGGGGAVGLILVGVGLRRRLGLRSRLGALVGGGRLFLGLQLDRLADLEPVGLVQAVEAGEIVNRHPALARDRGQGVALGHRGLLGLGGSLLRRLGPALGLGLGGGLLGGGRGGGWQLEALAGGQAIGALQPVELGQLIDAAGVGAGDGGQGVALADRDGLGLRGGRLVLGLVMGRGRVDHSVVVPAPPDGQVDRRTAEVQAAIEEGAGLGRTRGRGLGARRRGQGGRLHRGRGLGDRRIGIDRRGRRGRRIRLGGRRGRGRRDRLADRILRLREIGAG